MISQGIADKIKIEVDLIDIKKASTVLKSQIVGNGKVIYSKNEDEKINFQIRALKEYCLLNEERKVVLDKIQERGYIYAKGCASK